MREIKFRAWNKHTGMMEVDKMEIAIMGHYDFSYANYVHCSYDEEHGAYSVWGGSAGEERPVKDGSKSLCVIMQSIGRKDRHYRDMYEGDIFNDTADLPLHP
ncbi:MAG: YopX family protein, partial [Undibacterium sp.]